MVRYRRAMVVLALAGGNTVPVIARLVQTSEDRVREVIHNFNTTGRRQRRALGGHRVGQVPAVEHPPRLDGFVADPVRVPFRTPVPGSQRASDSSQLGRCPL